MLRHCFYLQAPNGVYINGVRLRDETSRALVDGDEIQLGVKPNPSDPATHSAEYFVFKIR